MKKLRGKKRYYRNLAKKAACFKLDLAPDDWYDFWHCHFDWFGQGNKRGRARIAHLKATFTAFENLLEQLKEYHKPYQVWLSFAAHDSSQDALYFHTPNPNQDNFPYLFKNYEWGIKAPALLSSFIKNEYEIGVTHYAGDKWYSVRVQKKA